MTKKAPYKESSHCCSHIQQRASPVESLEVKAPVGREGGQDPYWGASNLAGRSKCVNQVAPKVIARVTRIAGALGVPSRSTLGEGHADIVALELSMIGVPGVVEDGMPGRNGQRKPGTARGSPRRSRTAKASRISRCAVKSRCACERGGWGQLSDDGPRQHNSGRSEDPWGSGDSTSWRCTIESATRHCAGLALDHEVHERWMQTGQHAANVGSRLKRAWSQEGAI